MKTKNKRKHLSIEMFSCHWQSDRVSFSKQLASLLFQGGFEFVKWVWGEYDSFLYFTKEKQENSVPIYYSEYVDGNVRAQVYANGFARNILSWYSLKNQSWYMILCNFTKAEQLEKFIIIKPKENMAREQEQDLIRKCSKCGRELPVSEFYTKGKYLQSYCKECMKAHGRLRNGTTGEYRKTNVGLSSYTDQELWDELKSRGYNVNDNKLVKYQVLE